MIRVFARQVDFTDPDLTRNNLNLLENDVNSFVKDPNITIVSQRQNIEEWTTYTAGLIFSVLIEYNLRHR